MQCYFNLPVQTKLYYPRPGKVNSQENTTTTTMATTTTTTTTTTETTTPTATKETILKSIEEAGRITNAALIADARQEGQLSDCHWDSRGIHDFLCSKVCVKSEHIWSIGGDSAEDLRDALRCLTFFHPELQQLWIHFTEDHSYVIAWTAKGYRVYTASADCIPDGFALASTPGVAVASGPMEGWFLLKKQPAWKTAGGAAGAPAGNKTTAATGAVL